MQRTITLPIFMRGDDHEPVKVGNAQYNETRERLIFRVDIDARAGGTMHLMGKAIELGLVDGIQMALIHSQLAEVAVAAMDEQLEAEGANEDLAS